MGFFDTKNKEIDRSIISMLRPIFGGGEPSDPPSANYDIMISETANCDMTSMVDTIIAPCLTEDELAILRKYQRTVVATDAVECKIILIGRWTLNNQYEEEAEVRV